MPHCCCACSFAEPCCWERAPLPRWGMGLGSHTALLKSVLQQLGLRVWKQSRELSITTMQELDLSTFLCLTHRKGTSIQPVPGCSDGSGTFQGSTNHGITGGYQREHWSSCTGCTSLPHPAAVTGAAFPLALLQPQPLVLCRCQTFFPLRSPGAGFSNTKRRQSVPLHQHCPRTSSRRNRCNGF